MTTTILYGVYIIISVLLIIIILMQKSKNQGLSVTFGGTSVGDSFYNKNKSKTFEGKLETLTKIGIFVFIVLAVALNYVINSQTSIDLSKTPEGIAGQQTATSPTTNTTGENANQGTGTAPAPATTPSPAATTPAPTTDISSVAPVPAQTTTTETNATATTTTNNQ